MSAHEESIAPAFWYLKLQFRLFAFPQISYRHHQKVDDPIVNVETSKCEQEISIRAHLLAAVLEYQSDQSSVYNQRNNCKNTKIQNTLKKY